MNNNRTSGRRGLKQLIPVSVDGQQEVISSGAIPQKDWHKAHGTTLGGTKVNSAEFATYHGSTIIRAANGAAFSLDTPDAEILAVEMANFFGYNVIPKSGASRRARSA